MLAFGNKGYRSIRNASKFTFVMLAHKSIRKKNYNAIKKNDQKYEPLLRHFEYLKNLSEVQATKVVATLVNGMQGHTNRDDSLDVTYLPISMGYWSCYKQYMASLGYVVQTTAMGAYIVMGEGGKEVDAGEHCTFPTYFNLWKRDFLDFKVSRPVVYDDGQVSEHLHCHVYPKGIGKKSANNVASLIMNTLQKLNLLHEDSVGSELNIIFDNCSGQNKNNTVLKLPTWLMAMGYFKEIHFIFLVVGHTKNAADLLFNLLKHEYRKQNLFTFDKLVRTLDKSLLLTLHPTLEEDFLNYSKLLDGLYWPLTGNIQTNYIFSCTDDGTQITIRQSNLKEHQEYVLNLWKRGTWDGVTWAQLIEHADKVLKPIQCVGLNLYKIVKMTKNYRPNVPVEYHSDVMYAKPSEEVWSKVKVEKAERSEFRANLKAKKYAGKEQTESVAFGDGEAKM
jgi:hypothetical protein